MSNSSRVPPPLRWLESYCASLSRAIGQKVTLSMETTINPLVYRTKIGWEDPVDGKLKQLMWNMLQAWASRNGTTTNGRISYSSEKECVSLIVGVVLPNLSSIPKDISPWDKNPQETVYPGESDVRPKTGRRT